MNNDRYFILVSMIAFVSVGFIFADKFVYLNQGVNDKYASVTMASSASLTSSTTNKYVLPPESPTNYTDNKDGTIIDNYTGLIWKKCSQGTSGDDCKLGSVSLREWSKARVECEELNFAGKSGWRIPTLKELQSIVDSGAFNPSINKKFFISSNDPYWTLTSPAEYPASKFTVIFSDGSVYYNSVSNAAATRCVYDGSLK